MRMMKISLYRCFISMMALSVALVGMTPHQLLAQSANPDFTAPQIEHELIDSADPSVAQTVAVSVVDEDAVSEVILFYRFGGTEVFEQLQMTPSAAQESEYSVQIPIVDANATQLEYYIQAEDLAGNKSLKGHSFNPFVRRFVEPTQPAPIDTSKSTTSVLVDSSEPNTTPPAKKSKTIYYVLGAVALAALAGFALSGSGDDGGSSSSAPGCAGSDCELTLIFPDPE